MGSKRASILSKLFGKHKIRILMVGLDNAGKTTILYKLKDNETSVRTIPTLGFNVENVKYKNINFTVLDVGGQTNIRKFWSCYYENTQGIIYVIDSTDRQRVAEAKKELENMLEADELKDSVLLVFANKMDLPNAMSTSELADELGLTTLQGRTWFIQNTCAPLAQGLYEGLDWFSEELAKLLASSSINEKKKRNRGIGISSMFSKLFSSNKPLPISIFGLDNVGKTTILYKLKFGKVLPTIPTIGFNSEIVEYKNRKFDVWDIGAGGQHIIPIWYQYHRHGAGLIYVVDSSDRERIDKARAALETLLERAQLKNAVILILANKMDLPNTMSTTELEEKLELATLLEEQHSWFIQHTSATQAQGLSEGLNWLGKQLSKIPQ